MSLSIDDIRTYCKDIPEMNILLEGHPQSSDELIMLAMKLTTNDFNITTPKTDYSIEEFPSDSVMLYGVLHHLCNAEAERQLRNQMTYSAQGLQAGIDDKYQQYNSMASYYKQLFDQKMQQYKIYLNQEDAWGGAFSPYANINEWKYRD